ncbi:hypothetical protein Bca4012_092029 [Brassica carinata]
MHKTLQPSKIFFRHSPVSISMHIHPPPQLQNISQARHFFHVFFLVGVLKIMFKPPYI